MIDPMAADLTSMTAGVDPASIRQEDGLVIWPVPALDELFVYCPSNSQGNLPFELIDLTGKVIMRGVLQGGKANQIDLVNVKQGDHLLRVVDGQAIRSIAFMNEEL